MKLRRWSLGTSYAVRLARLAILAGSILAIALGSFRWLDRSSTAPERRVIDGGKRLQCLEESAVATP